MNSQKTYKVILSGGGTGGHIYPAVATAEALRRGEPNGADDPRHHREAGPEGGGRGRCLQLRLITSSSRRKKCRIYRLSTNLGPQWFRQGLGDMISVAGWIIPL